MINTKIKCSFLFSCFLLYTLNSYSMEEPIYEDIEDYEKKYSYEEFIQLNDDQNDKIHRLWITGIFIKNIDDFIPKLKELRNLKSINLHGNSRTIIEKMSKYLLHKTDLESLKLSSMVLNELDIIQLTITLCNLNNLTSLDLSCNLLNSEASKDLFIAFKYYPNLNILNLQACFIGETNNKTEAVKSLVEGLCHLSELKQLDLSNNKLGFTNKTPDGSKDDLLSIKYLTQGLNHLIKLEKLFLGANSTCYYKDIEPVLVAQSIKDLSEGLKNLFSLKVLDLSLIIFRNDCKDQYCEELITAIGMLSNTLKCLPNLEQRFHSVNIPFNIH